VNRKLTGLCLSGERVPPAGATVEADGRTVGNVTSAVHSLAREQVIALAYVHRNHLAPGTRVSVVASGYEAQGTVSALPAYS
jgi:glycine cleavage system aminomethyltransferase T